MTLKHLIHATALRYGITTEQLLNSHERNQYTQYRKELCYLAVQSAFNFADLEKATGISKTAWRNAWTSYTPQIEYVNNPIINIALQLEREEMETSSRPRLRKRKKKDEVKVDLGFHFTPEEEMLMEGHCQKAAEFMQNYGKGLTFQHSYGRVVRNRSKWYITD
jgi:hypothetical protein